MFVVAVGTLLVAACSSGSNVVVHYSEHRGVPTSCFGETEYFVDKAVIGGTNPVAPSNM